MNWHTYKFFITVLNKKKLQPLCDALVGFNIFSLIFKKNTSIADFRFFQMILTYLKKIIDYNIKFS